MTHVASRQYAEPLETASNGSPAPAAAIDPFRMIAADLQRVDHLLQQELLGYQPTFAPVIDHLRHYRGKMLRPALLLLFSKAVGLTTDTQLVLAGVIEMIHTATLVHDDVLDEAVLRRHRPTVAARWDNQVSILLGDLLFTHAFHWTARTEPAACAVIGAATNQVCTGELRQLLQRGNLELTVAEYMAIISGKTAALTECAARLGVLYAERVDPPTSDELAAHAAAYGRHLGIAFQITDDILDLTGRETTVGKTLGTDLEQHKLTLPLIHCFHSLPAAEAERLKTLLRHNVAESRPQILAALRKTNSLAYAARQAEKHLEQARQALALFPASPYTTVLESLLDWCRRRDK